MTRSGVEHKLDVTPYRVVITYGEDRFIEYFFSTESLRRKFENEYYSYRIEVKESIERRFKIKFYIANEFCDVNLYRKIESRGFRISINGRVYEWPTLLEYNGVQLEEFVGQRSNS